MADFGIGEALAGISALSAGAGAVKTVASIGGYQPSAHPSNILGPAGQGQLAPAQGYQPQSNPVNLNSYLNNLQNQQQTYNT